ncbi:hypothetical protein EII34_06300 [Arachnia propionica]|uniref:General stress protein 17M-like domain-containing protein n=1 Tax=Arachnia propionica TaxID=1750 RepID=A0A3P1T9F7_9ACTN|nr:general stress protein [Arachnia propionica]MDO5082262.1 hypothetical protein [Arachnia propionica]RRD05815.1 hypothetical protein EII34_06300 [Arachnia propionica]
MNPTARHGRLFELDYPQKVAEYDTYDEAQAAVDFLSDSLFEVENLMIVGTNLRSVERVMGRRTWARVLTQGMFSGIGTGLFVALMFHLFLDRQTNFFAILATGLALGVSFGVLSSGLSYGLSGGRRDFESMRQVVATGYEVLCEHKVAARARELLAARPGERTA